MLSSITPDRFREVGLLPYHLDFALKFFELNSPTNWLLNAPVGTATTRMAAHFVSWTLASRATARALVLAPAALLFQWQERMTEVNQATDVLVVDRKTFLELESNNGRDDELWPRRSIIIMSIDLAKRQDMRSALISTSWDLLVVDESHLLTGQRRGLYDAMNDAHCVNRALLLTPIPGTRLNGVARYEIAMEEVIDWNGRHVFSSIESNIYRISFTRSDEEVAFLQRLVAVGNLLVHAFVPGRFQKDILLRSASSSTYTVETVLRRLLDGWRPVRNKLAHNIPPSAEDLERIQSRVETVVDEVTVEFASPDLPARDAHVFLDAFRAIESLLATMDDIAVDSKFEALMKYLTGASNLASIHQCIWTSFRATGDYLSTSLDSLEIPVYYVNGGMDASARSGILEEFERSAGILIVTDVALEGTNLHFVQECINYDLPTSNLKFEQRWGRFLRFGRETSFQMVVFQDQGRSFDWEELQLTQILDDMGDATNP